MGKSSKNEIRNASKRKRRRTRLTISQISSLLLTRKHPQPNLGLLNLFTANHYETKESQPRTQARSRQAFSHLLSPLVQNSRLTILVLTNLPNSLLYSSSSAFLAAGAKGLASMVLRCRFRAAVDESASGELASEVEAEVEERKVSG